MHRPDHERAITEYALGDPSRLNGRDELVAAVANCEDCRAFGYSLAAQLRELARERQAPSRLERLLEEALLSIAARDAEQSVPIWRRALVRAANSWGKRAIWAAAMAGAVASAVALWVLAPDSTHAPLPLEGSVRSNAQLSGTSLDSDQPHPSVGADAALVAGPEDSFALTIRLPGSQTPALAVVATEMPAEWRLFAAWPSNSELDVPLTDAKGNIRGVARERANAVHIEFSASVLLPDGGTCLIRIIACPKGAHTWAPPFSDIDRNTIERECYVTKVREIRRTLDAEPEFSP